MLSPKYASTFIGKFLQDPDLGPNIVHIEQIPPVEASLVSFPPDLDPRLANTLHKRGLYHLYSHQRQAWDLIQEGNDVVVVTPTSSGKTLCFNLPVVQSILQDPGARALYLFPTKALSQDQQAELNSLIEAGSLNVDAATYDGDTPQSVRGTARDKARIIITNPDMLHSGVLPNHTKWIKFFSGLKYIVIDEMHAYRGVFGSHVANVMRRLMRIASFYGSNPKFIFCSATIANPRELAAALIGRPVTLVSDNGAPRAEKVLVFYNPPVVDIVQGIRKSSALESRSVAALLLKAGIRTILFARSRLRVELIAAYLNDYFRNAFNKNNGICVEPYRSGLLPNERRAIEKGLRDGTIQGVVSTNALELGIDIGGLDAAVMAGWPGSMASFRQQLGRAGRRQGLSLGVFVASSAPMDQYMMEHPERIMGESSEFARIDPENPYIYADHVKCAAFELPFSRSEKFGQDISAVLEFLQEDGTVRQTGDKWYWSSDAYPAEKISLRSATADNIVIIDTTRGANTVIGEMDRPSAKELIFDDAVYMHRGRQYCVLKLDLENKLCQVEEKELNYYTDAVVKTDIKVLSEDESLAYTSCKLVLGDLLIRSQAEKFKKIRFHTHENIGYGEIYLPPEEIQTRGLMVLAFQQSGFARKLESLPTDFHRAALLSSLSYIFKSLAPVFLLCDPSDLGASWRLRDDHFQIPVLYMWDKYPGGTGLSEALLSLFGQLVDSSAKRVASCACVSGCPSCIGLPDPQVPADANIKIIVAGVLDSFLETGHGA